MFNRGNGVSHIFAIYSLAKGGTHDLVFSLSYYMQRDCDFSVLDAIERSADHATHDSSERGQPTHWHRPASSDGHLGLSRRTLTGGTWQYHHDKRGQLVCLA